MVTIRKAQPQDIDSIYSLGSAVPEFLVNKRTVNFWPKKVLREAVTANDVVVLVAEVDHKVVGFVIASLTSSLRKATIENIYVHTESRGNGIGDELLASLLEVLSDNSIEYMATLVPVDAVEATKLYETAGFLKGETFLWLDKSITNTFKSF